MRILGLLALLGLALPAAAQRPRSSVQVDPGLTGPTVAPSVASEGEVTAILFKDDSDETVHVAVSDGRGRVWASPVRVDTDGTNAGKFVENWSVAVVDGSVYAAWRDERNGASNDEVFFAFSNDGGVTWSTDTRIDKNYPIGTGAVRDWRMAVTDNGASNSVYFLISVDPNGASNEELYLVASHDGGATFGLPVAVSTLSAGTADVDAIALAADGNDVFIAFQDDRTLGPSFDEVWFQKSTDGGATFLGSDVQVDDNSTSGDAEDNVTLALSGSTVVISWSEERAGPSNEELRANVSFDGGSTWQGDLLVGAYTPGTDDVDSPSAGVSPSGNAIVAWEDNRTGADQIFVSSTSDGLTWSADVQLSTGGGGFPFVIDGPAGAVRDCDIVIWTGGSFPEDAEASLTMDGGATWGTSFTVSDNTGSSALLGDADFAFGAFNELYDNFHVVWLSDHSGGNQAFAGGVRPQTLTPMGFIAGGSLARFKFANYVPQASNAIGIVLIAGSESRGAFPLADGRDSGLNFDAISLTGLQFLGFFLAAIDSQGDGQTPQIAVNLPAGFLLSAVGVGFNGALVPDLISDVENIVF